MLTYDAVRSAKVGGGRAYSSTLNVVDVNGLRAYVILRRDLLDGGFIAHVRVLTDVFQSDYHSDFNVSAVGETAAAAMKTLDSMLRRYRRGVLGDSSAWGGADERAFTLTSAAREAVR
jgi:hypothetical protein